MSVYPCLSGVISAKHDLQMRFSPNGSPNIPVFVNVKKIAEIWSVSPPAKQFSTVTLILEFRKLGENEFCSLQAICGQLIAATAC